MPESPFDADALRVEIEDLFDRDLTEAERERARRAVELLLDGLERGRLRAAEPDGDGWRVNAWVKRGILLAFRASEPRDYSLNRHFQYRDVDLLGPLPWIGRHATLRVVPGGTTIRRGACIGENVILMPPAYVNVGAWIGEGTMIDSHALVGSCAQVGARVHLSAGAQIGGVLEPVGATPVVIEDDVFVGGNTGVYEGVRVRRGAVLAAGAILTAGTPVYDLTQSRVLRTGGAGPVEIPPYAVVVPGSRPAGGAFAQERGLHLQTPVIVKYRDPEEPVLLALEDALR